MPQLRAVVAGGSGLRECLSIGLTTSTTKVPKPSAPGTSPSAPMIWQVTVVEPSEKVDPDGGEQLPSAAPGIPAGVDQVTTAPACLVVVTF